LALGQVWWSVKRSKAGESCSNASVDQLLTAYLVSQRLDLPGRTIEYPYCFETKVAADRPDAAATSRSGRIAEQTSTRQRADRTKPSR